MRRLNLVLLATAQLCLARHPGFSIHDDLVAYPQYEVVFSESYVLEDEAQALLDRTNPHSTYSAEFSTASDISQNVREAGDADGGGGGGGAGTEVVEKYEIMKTGNSRYLCSIPVVEPQTPENHTATELAKQEEARELAKASAHGWELLGELDGKCLYFMSGWWSYSFCYNRDIVQFHALPTVPNGQPPVPDPHTAKYVLGRVHKSPGQRHPTHDGEQQQQQQTTKSGDPPANTDLQIKGDQRYLVQRMDGGTLCDLTGRERTVEVQYHCVPGMKGDRIGWIKEVTTCAYLMVVNTPRLCNDVVFLPPQETSANAISCRPILPSDDPGAQADWHRRHVLEADETSTTEAAEAAERELDAQAQAQEEPELELEPPRKMEKEHQQQHQYQQHDPNAREGAKGVNVGGVIVGARNVLADADEEGKPPAKLAPPRSYLPGRGQGPLVEIIASAKSKAEGGATEVLDESELKKLDLSPELVEEMRAELERIAGDRGWKLEVVEQPGDPRELRGVVDHGPEEEEEEKGEGEGEGGGGGAKGKRKTKGTAEGGEEQREGSEEHFFKEEL